MNALLPILETERLILRQMTVDDAEALFSHFSDDDVTRYMDISSFTHVDQAIELIAEFEHLIEKNVAFRWAIIHKHDNTLIGTCGYHNWVKNRASRVEIGYGLSKAYWGQGLVPEGLKKAIPFAFTNMQVNRIEALVLSDAKQSMRVLHKLGFQSEGIRREYGYWKNQFWDEHCFSLLKSDWKNICKN